MASPEKAIAMPTTKHEANFASTNVHEVSFDENNFVYNGKKKQASIREKKKGSGFYPRIHS